MQKKVSKYHPLVSRIRADGKKNRNVVSKLVLKNPDATQSEIARKAWLGVSTVNNILNQIEKTPKDTRIIAICNQDLEIVELANKIRKWFVEQVITKLDIRNMLNAWEYDKLMNLWIMPRILYDYEIWSKERHEVINAVTRQIWISKDEVSVIDKISDTSQKRYSIFMGKATDENWGLNWLFNELSTEELMDKLMFYNKKEAEDGLEW